MIASLWGRCSTYLSLTIEYPTVITRDDAFIWCHQCRQHVWLTPPRLLPKQRKLTISPPKAWINCFRLNDLSARQICMLECVCLARSLKSGFHCRLFKREWCVKIPNLSSHIARCGRVYVSVSHYNSHLVLWSWESRKKIFAGKCLVFLSETKNSFHVCCVQETLPNKAADECLFLVGRNWNSKWISFRNEFLFSQWQQSS